MMTRALAGLTGLFLFAQAFAETPEQRFEAAAKRLTPCEYCVGIADTPQDIAAQEVMWQAIADWTVERLNSGRTLEQIRTEMLNVGSASKDFAPTAIAAIGPDLYAATSGVMDSTGTFFIVGRKGRHFAVLWDVRHASEDMLAQFPTLRAWSAKSARDACRSQIPDDTSDTCGPLSGVVTALRPDGQGRPRFLVRATFSQLAGMTVGNQATFWRWDGRAAEPLIAKTYAFMIDDGAATETVTPDKVSLWVKDEFKTFFSCGGCIGRQVKWTFRMLPDRIVDEGKTAVVPELDAVDAFVLAVLNDKPASGLGSAKAIAALKAVLDENTDAVDTDMASLARLGMEMDRTVNRTPQGASVCLFADGLPATVFDLERRSSGFFVTAARPAGSESCTQPAKK